MADNKYMEEYENKLRESAQNSAEQMKNSLKDSVKKEKNDIAKSLYQIYSNTGIGNPPGELGKVMGSGALFVEDDDF